MDTLKHEIPDYVIMPYHIPESSLPIFLDDSRTGYASGQERRRKRREQQRKNKKK